MDKKKTPAISDGGISTFNFWSAGMPTDNSIIWPKIACVYLNGCFYSNNQSQGQGKTAILKKGAKHTLDRAVATPTVSGVLSCPEFKHPQNFVEVTSSFGRGASDRKAGGIARSMCLTPRPPHTHKHVNGWFYQSHRGDLNHV